MRIGTLSALEQAKAVYGGASAQAKLALLGGIAQASLPSARAVRRLHEVLCFLRAYPDDAGVLATVERMLKDFGRRADLRCHRGSLADTGIAGTTTHYRFFWPTARWLARHWPKRFQLDRREAEPIERLRAALPVLVTHAEAGWLKEIRIPAYQALDRLCARGESDAVFLVRRVAAMPGNSLTREAFSDAIDASFELKPGADTPSRTLAKYSGAPIAFQNESLRRGRPDLRGEIRRPPRRVHELSPREGVRLIDIARGAMVARGRDLDAFAYGDPGDVRLVDDGGGLSFMVNGVEPERRALIAAAYGYLILRNGVPIGYGQLDFVGRSAAISFNIFETFRGGEAAVSFARLLAMAKHVFGAQSFSVDPYQLGHHNEEGIASGAWWFYCKLGFQPRSQEALRIRDEELARMQAKPGYRSDKATLRRLAAWHLFFDLRASRAAGLLPVAELGVRIAQGLAARAAADRERALAECSRQAMRLTGLATLRGFSPDELRAWTRWAPLIVVLPGLARWSAAEKRALVRVVRAKGGRRESEFIARFAAHPKLERSLFAGDAEWFAERRKNSVAASWRRGSPDGVAA